MILSITEEKSEIVLRERKISLMLRCLMTVSGVARLDLLSLSSVRAGNVSSREETVSQLSWFPLRISW